jgi:phospholipid/cholesterol/gamma-HCH transport system substrate-binding protein
MRTKEAQHVRVGVFVFLSLAVAAFIIFMIGSEKQVFESRYTLKCTFSDISGLRIGAPVQLAGVRVGFVEDIRFPKDLMQKDIEVVLGVSKKFQERIREDSIATINTQGLLGDKFVFISVGSAEEPVIPDGGVIKAKEAVGLFDLAEKGGEILEDLQGAAKSISTLLGDMSDGKGGVQESLKAIRNILTETEKGRGLIHALIYDPRGQQILGDMSSSMSSLKVLLGQSAEGQAGRGQIKNVAQNINKAAFNLSQITDKINKGEGTLGGLINDPTIYNEIRSIFGKANRNALFKTVVRATLEENEKSVLK